MTQVHTEISHEVRAEQFEGKYLTFLLNTEQYAIDILRVQEIIRLAPVTRVPRSPKYFAGVMNLRGRIVSVVDLRKKLDLHVKEFDEKTCIIVLHTNLGERAYSVGLIVDSVEEVSFFPGSSLQEPPDVGLGIDSSVIRAVTQQNQHLVMLLDIDKILQEDLGTFSDAETHTA